jgi:hypothetical protein
MSALEHPCAMDELDQLLAESKAAAKKKPAAADLGELDDLLKESISLRDEEVATKLNRERLKRQNLSSDERREIESKVREWEARNLWNPVATVAVFDRTYCACGCYVQTFSHLMHKQMHKTDPTLSRMVMTDTTLEGKPRMVAFQDFEVELCDECAAEKGWDLENAVEVAWDAAKI